MSSLPHSYQTKRLRSGDLVFLNSSSVISDFQHEFVVDLFNGVLVDVVNYGIVAYVGRVYNGNTVTMRIPLQQLPGSNGNVNLATVVGDDNGPTDIAPNEGNLTMGAPNMVAAVGARPLGRTSLSWAAQAVAPAPSRVRGTKLTLGR